MKIKVTMLHLLDEGDKFQFANEDGTLKSDRMYYVEGQYPKFGCTTVCAETNILPCSSGYGQSMKIVTAVEDIQWVHLVTEHAIDICHKVKFLR